jgi:hypothetical protein
LETPAACSRLANASDKVASRFGALKAVYTWEIVATLRKVGRHLTFAKVVATWFRPEVAIGLAVRIVGARIRVVLITTLAAASLPGSWIALYAAILDAAKANLLNSLVTPGAADVQAARIGERGRRHGQDR